MNDTLASIQNQLTGSDQSVELIGHQVFWSLSDDSAVAYETLKQVALNAGFEAKSYHDGGVLPRETTPCSAWARAISDFAKTQHFRDLELVIDSESIPADRDTKTPARGLLTVHKKTVDSGAAEVSFQQQIAIEFDKSASADQDGSAVIRSVNGEGDLKDWVYTSIVWHYNDNLRRVNVNDVRETVKRILHKVRSFKMKPSGGIYFVPVQYTQTVEALKTFVSGLTGSTLFVLDLPKISTRTIETIRETAAEAMEQELEQLKADIATGLNSSRLAKKGADSTTHARLVELINDYRDRAEFYGDYLSVQKEQISATVATLEQQVMAAIS